ncbi:MAG: hypothetical protein ACYDA8_19340 [Deferrisomatales bacterium]
MGYDGAAALADSRVSALEEAAAAQARETRALAESLRQARAAAEGLRSAALESALESARGRADALARTGARLSRLAGDAARGLGLPAEASLAAVARSLGYRGGRLAAEVEAAAQALAGVARESGALGLAARYGAGVAGHLLGLASGGLGYGPAGRPSPALSAYHRRV